MQHGDAILPFLLLAVGLLELHGRCHAASRQLARPLGLRLQKRQLVLGLFGFGPDLAQVRLHLFDGGACGIDFGFGLGQRKLIGGGIEAHQHLARLDDRMVPDLNLDDTAGNLTGDLGDVGLDVGVFGRDVAAALQPGDQRADSDEHGHADQRQFSLRGVMARPCR